MKTKLILRIAIILSVLIISMSSCFSDSMYSYFSDDYNSSYSDIQINPPEWIQGTWLTMGTQNGWRFTSYDIIRVSRGHEDSYQEKFQSYVDNGLDISVSDTYTDVSYIATINFEGVVSIKNFTKLSDTEITELSTPTAVFIKQ